MLRSSGNFFSRKLDSLADTHTTANHRELNRAKSAPGARHQSFAASMPAGDAGFAYGSVEPVVNADYCMDEDPQEVWAAISDDGLSSGSDSDDADEEDSGEMLRVQGEIMPASTTTTTTSATSRLAEFGSSVVSKVEDFFGSVGGGGSARNSSMAMPPPPPPGPVPAPAPASAGAKQVPAAPPKPSPQRPSEMTFESEERRPIASKKMKSGATKDRSSSPKKSAEKEVDRKRKSSRGTEEVEGMIKEAKASMMMSLDLLSASPASLSAPEAEASPAARAPSSFASVLVPNKAKAAPIVALKKAETAMDLIVRAKSNGGFVLDAALASLLGKTLMELLEKIPVSLNHLPDLWATALVLATLNSRFAATKEEWSLFQDKGRKLLAKTIASQNLNTTVDSLLQSASEAL